jgi:hypothetical protein
LPLDGLTDLRFVCIDCDRVFVWSVASQQLYDRLGYHSVPRCCPRCRGIRREMRKRGVWRTTRWRG